LDCEFAQPFFIELNSIFVPIDLVLQFEGLLLGMIDSLFQLSELIAELGDLMLPAQNVLRTNFDLDAQLPDRILPLPNFCLKHVKLMPGQLGVQMLQLQH
jgi:hypothetical protein